MKGGFSLDAITALDFTLLNGIQEHLRAAFLDGPMRTVTLLGENGILSIVLALVLLAIPKTRKAGAALAAALVLQLLVVNLGLKPLVARPRPYVQNPAMLPLVEPLPDYSFPSGHTSCLFLTAVVLGRRFPKGRGAFFAVAALVGFSRLYLYVHFPTDVLAGAVIGVLCGLAGLWLVNRLGKGNLPSHSSSQGES